MTNKLLSEAQQKTRAARQNVNSLEINTSTSGP